MERASEQAAALQLHRQGRLDEAARRYEALLRGKPRDPDLLGLMGIVEQQRGRLGSGAARLDVALGLEASDSVQVRNLNARAIIEKEEGRLATLPDLLTRHRPAAPIDAPADGGAFGAYVSLASFAMDTGEAALAGDLAAACKGAGDIGTTAQRQQLGTLLAALGLGDDLEALAAGMAARDHVAARTLWLRAWSAAEKAKRWDVTTLARHVLRRDFPAYRDPRRGTDTDALRVLVLRAAPPHVYLPEQTFYWGSNTIGALATGYDGPALAFDGYVVGNADLVPEVPPPDGVDVVFNNIANAEMALRTGGHAAAKALTDGMRVPVLNPPEKVARTTRTAIAKALAGIEGLVVPKILSGRSVAKHAVGLTRRIERDIGLPVILRTTEEHTGRNMNLCRSMRELKQALESFDGHRFYAIQFFDTQVEPRLWRKYRAIFVDGQVYPFTLSFSDDWNVHLTGWRRIAPKRPDLVAREQHFLDELPSALGAAGTSALMAIGEKVGLDFFGADFTLDAEGRLILFETNATMRVLTREGMAELPQLNASRDRIWQAFEAMLIRRAEEGRAARQLDRTLS